MQYDKETLFSRAMMTGLFIGVIDTIICLAYNIGYRDMTGYTPSALINVSSLIFSVNLLLLLIGMIYFVFIKLFGKKDFIFVIVFFLLTLLSVWQTETGHRFADQIVNTEFKGLLLGIVLITGISASAIPFFFHSKFFEKYVL
jgi:hypothetical protein